MKPVIVVHGGAGTIDDARLDDARLGCEAAAAAGARVLGEGGDAQAAVVAAVRILEDDPTFNAGRGACMTDAGTFEVDAGLMCSDGRIGAVGAVPDLADAILVARAVLEHSRHALLVGEGAVRFALAHGVGTFGRDAVWTDKAQARYEAATRDRTHDPSRLVGQADTVGAVALDARGQTAVACSTGGVLLKSPGRVGDSPIVGAGLFAGPDGAACATGVGEAILARVATYELLRRIAAGQAPHAAAQAVCDEAAGHDATCGLIVVCPDGRVALAHHSRHMSWAIGRPDHPVEAGIAVPTERDGGQALAPSSSGRL